MLQVCCKIRKIGFGRTGQIAVADVVVRAAAADEAEDGRVRRSGRRTLPARQPAQRRRPPHRHPKLCRVSGQVCISGANPTTFEFTPAL
jgi:hypothetical protein